MTFGFSGASEGMTQRQRAAVRYLFLELLITILHHGDCIGADAQAHALATELKILTEIHPPTNPDKRAWCMAAHIIHPPKAYLKRNMDIAKAGVDGLIAAPPNFIEIPNRGAGSGTWSTVRYARLLKRRVWVVVPDGTFREEFLDS